MEEVRITGEVEDIIFQNKDNGYTVFSLTTENDEVTCVGVLPQIHSGEALEIRGEWKNHPVYGKQLQVQYYEKSMPTTQAGMEKYLASGLIRGIGAKTAKRIVEKFGETAFYVIEEKPDLLTDIKGITYEKAQRISEVFREQHELRRAMMFLQGFDISPAYAMKIYKKFKNRTFDIVKNNPYRLADDVLGIGFKMADKMAANVGIAEDNPNRVKAAVKYVLNNAAANGDCFLPKGKLIEDAVELLGLHPLAVENAIRELQVDSQLWQERLEESGGDCVYLNYYFYAEMAVAKHLLELSAEYEPADAKTIARAIERVEKGTGVILAEEQRLAVLEAMSSGVLIITGGPGTGKTTTINAILRILQEEEQEVVLAAPTGRAAKRMTEATGCEAQTIHRMLELSGGPENASGRAMFARNEENPLEADVIIIDEMSMVDIHLMQALLKAVIPGTRLILVGDVNQLPSVGPGRVLQDLIGSKAFPVVRLTRIFRQAAQSDIIVNAHKINRGEQVALDNKSRDFFFLRRQDPNLILRVVLALVQEKMPRYVHAQISDIQVLTPMRKGALGVENLNQVLQRYLNPPSKDKEEKEHGRGIFRVGDKVMQIRNNYQLEWEIRNRFGIAVDRGLGVFNGDMGLIRSINSFAEELTVEFDEGRMISYPFKQLDELELAYAITVHKSQGSEYPAVVIPLLSGPRPLMNRNLLYTAVTRARSCVTLVGSAEIFQMMVENETEQKRYTGLAEIIKSYLSP